MVVCAVLVSCESVVLSGDGLAFVSVGGDCESFALSGGGFADVSAAGAPWTLLTLMLIGLFCGGGELECPPPPPSMPSIIGPPTAFTIGPKRNAILV